MEKKNNKNKKPTVTPARSLLSLRDIADDEVVNAVENDKGVDILTNEISKPEKNAENRDSFSTLLEKAKHYKATTTNLKQLYIDENLRIELDILKMITDTPVSALLSAIVDNFIEQNADAIKEYKKQYIPNRF